MHKEISQELQKYDIFFRFFWELGGIRFLSDKEADALLGERTAAILFDEDGEAASFVWAKSHWDSINSTTRSFVLCHEMLHVLFKHGFRFLEHLGKPLTAALVNYATDVVINELLVAEFGFRREELSDIAQKWCWYDTVFPKGVKKGRSADYYFLKLQNEKKIPDVTLVDAHLSSEGLEEFLGDSGLFQALDEELMDKLSGVASKEEMESILSEAGNEALGARYNVQIKKRKKKKWESIIKKWEHCIKKSTEKEEERWDLTARRYVDILDGMSDIFLPTSVAVESVGEEEGRITVFFFLDTSGSCISYKQRFFNAANSLDKKRFDVRLFCFDTSVYETTLKSGRVYGGGGTSFSILEAKIQQILQKEKIPYPKSVWVITDGYGNDIRPQYPERWNWFLTPHNSKSYIPAKSKKYKLSDYE